MGSTGGVKITVTDTEVSVVSPYNSEFVKQAKHYGGRYANNAWIFNIHDEGRVRDLCKKYYGTDGTTEPDVCTVRVFISSSIHTFRGPIEFYGRTIAKASHHASGARLGEGVVLIKGEFLSGGTGSNWKTKTGDAGATVLIRNFPRGIAEGLVNAGKKWISIIYEPPVIDVSAITAEKRRLLERIDEIDSMISRATKGDN
jgi:hypothetical protein